MTHPLDLGGQRALVTGANRGIGRSIALQLAAQGSDVCVHHLDSAGEAETVAEQIRLRGHTSGLAQADLSLPDGPGDCLRQSAEALGGPPTILVANAAMQIRQDFGHITREAAQMQFETNFLGTLNLLQGAVPAMRRAGGGRIVVIGSVQQAVPNPQLLVYGALKSALHGAVRNLAVQLASDRITVNMVAPGVIVTDLNRAVLSNGDYRAEVIASIPFGDFGTPEDCAVAAGFLCSPAGRCVTGETIYVDGGMHLGACGQ